MVVINVYSIIVSKVFSMTIDDNFLFAIVVERFHDGFCEAQKREG
jgi:hypothetical protein